MKKKFNLKEGEMVCRICGGVGKVRKIRPPRKTPFYVMCSHCQGTGRVDWVENIVGKKPMAKFSTDEIVEKLALQMARDIDEKILKTLSEEAKKGGSNFC